MQLQVDVPTLTLYLQLFFVDGSKKQLRRKENRVEEKKSKCVKKPLDRLKGIPLRFSFFLHTAFTAATLCQKTIIRPKTQFTISHEKPLFRVTYFRQIRVRYQRFKINFLDKNLVKKGLKKF